MLAARRAGSLTPSLPWKGYSPAGRSATLRLTALLLAGSFSLVALQAQSNYATPYYFTTLAGSTGSYGWTDGTGSAANFLSPDGVAVDGSGNVYVANTNSGSIRKITPVGVVKTLTDTNGNPILFNFPNAVAVDGSGNVYVADTYDNVICKITPAGVVTTLAGWPGLSGTADGTGSDARFFFPDGVAVDRSGIVYVADTNNDTIRKITPAGVVTTLAGTAGTSGSTDGMGSAAKFNRPWGVTVDGSGDVYVADTFNSTIRQITAAGVVTTIAGTAGSLGSSDGTGTAAQFSFPQGVAVDGSGNLYVADTYYSTIRKITAGGVVTTIGGTVTIPPPLDAQHIDAVSSPPTIYPNYVGSNDGIGSSALFSIPGSVAVDASGNVYVADTNHETIRKGSSLVITAQPSSQTVNNGGSTSFATAVYSSPNPTYQWQLLLPNSTTWTDFSDNVTYSGSGTATLTVNSVGAAMNGDSFQCVITNSNGTVTSSAATLVVDTPLTVVTLAGLAGITGSADGSGTSARFADPSDVATDAAGNLYVADTDNHTVRKITPAGVVTTLAGQAGVSGSNDGSKTASFNHPAGVAVDNVGTVYVADTNNNEIRMVTPAGAVSTLAGRAEVAGSSDGIGTAASFDGPSGIVADATGNLYVADTLNHTIRKVTTTGVVTTIAGVAGATGFADGNGTAAKFHGPQGLALDASNNLFVADTNNNAIRKIVTTTGAVTTVAGQAGIAGSTDGANSLAQFYFPSGIAVDAVGNLYVADTDNGTLREIALTGAVSTLAGLAGFSGNADGVGTAARFDFPTGVTVDTSGNVYVADTNNNTIRLAVSRAAPAITMQPLSQTTTAGSNVTFLVTATGKPVPTYQWYFNGTTISGATSNSYNLASAQTANAGNYTVTVSNVIGSVISSAAMLTINATSGGGGGGDSSGGGGAPSSWFCGALFLIVAVRSFQRRPKSAGHENPTAR